MTFKIRAFKPKDARAVQKMTVALCEYHGSRATVTAKQLEQFCLSHVICHVAVRRGALVGYVVTHDRFNLQYATRSGDVHMLYVTPKARGRGVGRALMRHAAKEALARGCSGMAVYAYRKNLESNGFYQKLNWSLREENSNCYVLGSKDLAFFAKGALPEKLGGRSVKRGLLALFQKKPKTRGKKRK